MLLPVVQIRTQHLTETLAFDRAYFPYSAARPIRAICCVRVLVSCHHTLPIAYKPLRFSTPC